MNLALKGRRIVSLQTPSHCGAYAEPFQGKANLSTIPRASLRCALGWYADAPSALKKPIIFLGERLSIRNSRFSFSDFTVWEVACQVPVPE